MITFSVLASIAMFCLNLFSFICLFCQIDFFKKWRWIIAVLLIVITVVETFYFLSFRRSSGNVLALQFAASLVGLTFSLFFISLVYFVLRIPVFTLPFSESRRRALKFMLDITIVIAAVSWVIKGFVGGFSKPIKRKVEVKIKNLSSPISIAQITDVHIGKVLGFDFMSDVVNITNELNADVIVITGDLFDLPPKHVKDKLEPLRDLKSRFGVYYVLGNHEYYVGSISQTIELIESFGIKVLQNQSVIIDGKINLAGIYDLRGERHGSYAPDVQKALLDTDKTLPTVLLSHQPKIVKQIAVSDKVDLIISGHTHGGQIFPFGLFVLIDQPYLYGLYRHDETTQVFVSSGTGYWGPPVRILAPSEIVKLELKPSGEQ